MSDNCGLRAADGGPVAHMHVHQVPELVYTDAGFIYEGHPMKVIGLSTSGRGTDNPGLEIRLITMEESKRRRRAAGIDAAVRLGRHMQNVADRERIPGADRFAELCNRLYKELGEENGGPLHVQLEDANIDHLVGNLAVQRIAQMREAMGIIGRGNAPAHYDPGHNAAYSDAHFYQAKPAVLQCAIEILEITRHWTEDQAWAVYRPWAKTVYGKASRPQCDPNNGHECGRCGETWVEP